MTELEMLASMVRIRRVEESIAERYSEQQMRTPVHLCVGQEAPPVGVSSYLRQTDKVLSGHRSHGQYLAKGGNLRAMVAEIYGRATGCSAGKGGSQHLIDLDCGFLGSAPILASTLSIGVGVAWRLRAGGTDDVCVVYFGDAATEEGVFHEALSFASLHQLPVVFVCENNLYSTHAGLAVRQPARPIADLALGHALPSLTANGNDVLAVCDASGTAITRARAGDGPTLLVFDTYRLLEHVGPGDDTHMGYRSPEEVEEWRRLDPIKLSASRIQAAHPDWRTLLEDIESAVALEIDDAFDFALRSPFPDPCELMTQVFPSRMVNL